MRTQIIGSGFVTGEHLVTNDQLSRVMDTSDEWIRERSGIETRYFVEQGTTTSDLGLGAARKAIEDAGIAKDEIDYIVFATMTPDHYFPGCGGILQEKLGLGTVPALDVLFRTMPASYFLTTPEETIVAHAELRRQFGERETAGERPAVATQLGHFPEREYTEFAV